MIQRNQESATLIMINDTIHEQPNEETCRVRSGTVLNAELCALSPGNQGTSPMQDTSVCLPTSSSIKPQCSEFLLGFLSIGTVDQTTGDMRHD